jgi:hypothetical protein
MSLGTLALIGICGLVGALMSSVGGGAVPSAIVALGLPAHVITATQAGRSLRRR